MKHEFRDSNPKIDIYVRRGPKAPWGYACSTNWSRTCREAKTHFLASRPQTPEAHVKACRA